jgi:CubicO group peptidase (beta-lactamase class C family)
LDLDAVAEQQLLAASAVNVPLFRDKDMRKILAALAIASGLSGAGTAAAVEPRVAAPETQGFDAAALAEVVLAAKASGKPIHSLTLVRAGQAILDIAFYPYDGSSLHDMASVTKSVTTSLIAIAAADGKLDLDAPMVSFFPGRQMANRDARKEGITVRQLTQNLSGLACIGAPEELTLAQMQASPDFVQFALDLPMAAEPGIRFDYCSPGMHILSAILQGATGKTAFTYAREKLFGPLGIVDVAWDADPQGTTRGWGDLHLSPRDMIKLGELWLHGGAWQGQQLIPAAWMAAATTGAVKSDRHEDYGYGFWVGPRTEPVPYFFAAGRGGQRILAVPAFDLVVATTGGGFDPGDIIDPIAGTLVDPAKPLPPNPSGAARLADAIAMAEAAPPPEPVQPLPAIGAAANGKTYAFLANPYALKALKLTFSGGAEAVLALTDRDGTVERPVGLDGVYRWSPGPNGVRYGVSGRWTDVSTMVLDYNTIGDIRAYTITLRFSGETLEVTFDQRDEPAVATLTGRIEAIQAP